MTTFSLAAAALVGHAPALAMLGHRLTRPMILANVVAVAVTLAAMLVAYTQAGGIALLAAWLVGHFVWGAVLAIAIATHRDRAITARRAR